MSALVLVLAGAGLGIGTSSAGASAGPTAAAPQAPVQFSTGQQTVAGFAIAPDGRVFYVGPASPKIFVWSPRTHAITTFATAAGSGFGIVLSPTFASDHHVFAYFDAKTSGGLAHEKLLRYDDAGDVGKNKRVLRDVGPTGSEHTGGKLVFSPNGKNLFLVVGDGGNLANSQNPAIDHGKILRLTPLGAAAPGNPGYADPAIWATGIRNSIGMAFDPATAHMWETENGPECNDEINSISGGKNYGWGPHEVCDGTVAGTNQDGASPTLPAENIANVVAPTGVTFCSGCGVPGLQGDMVYGRYLTNDLRKVTLDATHQRITSDTLLYQGNSAPLAVETSPVDGSIWFADLGHTMRRLG